MKRINNYFDIYNIVLSAMFLFLISTIILESFGIQIEISAVIWRNILIITLAASILKIIISIVKKQKKLMLIPVLVFIILFIMLYYVYINVKNRRYPVDEKPIIYIYPEEKIELSIKLKNDELLYNTYPNYDNGWDVIVDEDGNIYDKKTNRNYYALYYDSKDETKINEKEGFIVYKDDLVSFLEEKLELLGLNEREINEFIIYWLPQLNKNDYNYIRFRTTEEVNKYMPIDISIKPDTLIRVYMDYKKASKNDNVTPQKLEKAKRNGFTIVEWGGREL